MSAVLPHDVEAVFCKLYSHYTYAVLHTKISTNTPTKVILPKSRCKSTSIANKVRLLYINVILQNQNASTVRSDVEERIAEERLA